jgi:hypothetical protein
MTQTEATIEATRINDIIGEGTATAKTKVFAYWMPTYVKQYNTVLIPAKYEVQYDAATDSQAIAFQRVSLKAQKGNLSLADYVAQFDIEGAEDTELAAYLGL